jgi:hypothetical protein
MKKRNLSGGSTSANPPSLWAKNSLVEQNERLRKLMGTLIHWAESEEK